MVSTVYLDMKDLMPKIQEYQTETAGNPNFVQLTRTIPDEYDDFTEAEKVYFNTFLCDNTRMYYHESNYFDYTGTVAYKYEYNYDFKCMP